MADEKLDKLRAIAKAKKNGWMTSEEAIVQADRVKAMDGVQKSNKPEQEIGTLETLGRGAQKELTSTTTGILQLLANQAKKVPFAEKAIDFPGIESELSRVNQEQNQRLGEAAAQNPWTAFAGGMVGSALVPIPGITAGKSAKGIYDALRLALKEGAFQGGVGAGSQYTPEGESKTLQTLFGAGVGLGVGSGLTAALNPKQLMQGVRPSVLFDTGVTEEKLMANLAATQGTNTGLGQVIESPALQMIQENLLNKLPFSGGQQSQQIVQNQIGGQAENVLGNLTQNQSMIGGSPNESALLELKRARDIVRESKKGRYGKENDLAEQLNVVSSDALSSTAARERLTEATGNKKLTRNLPAEVRSDLEVFSMPGEMSLKEADLFRSQMGEKSKNYGKAGEDYLAGIYSAIRGGVEKDIEEAINVSGSKELKGLRDDAHKYYREHYAPFKKRVFSKFLNDEQANPDKFIESFVRLGKTKDNSFLLKSLMDRLSEGQNFPGASSAVRQGVYGKARDNFGELNPSSLATLFRNTGHRTQEQMLRGSQNPAELSKQMTDFQRLVEMNPQALQAMFNPKTGNVLTALIAPGTILGGAGSGAAIGAGIGGPIGAGIGGLGGALVGSGAGLGKYLNDKLTSPETREGFVRALMENRKRSDVPQSASQKELIKLLSRGAGGSTVNKEEKK